MFAIHPLEALTVAPRDPETGLAASIMILLEPEFLLPTPLRKFRNSRYHADMRPLWPIERSALQAMAKDNPTIAEAILRQADCAQVTAFENTGAGFFSTVAIVGDAPALPALARLDGAHGNVVGIEHGMGFIVFLEGGRICLLEGYVNGVVRTKAIDFSKVSYELWPWCEPED